MAKKLSIAFAMTVFVCSSCAAASAPLTVTSPDGNLSVSLGLKVNPQPYLSGDRAYYRVLYKGTAILRDSPLGLDFLGAPPLDHSFEILGSTPSSHKDTWENPLGTKRVVPDHYNQLSISLQERDLPHRRLDIIFRAFNAGIAFRYFLPKQKGLEKFILSSENTGFYFARQAFAYASTSNRHLNAYETQFSRVNVSEIEPNAMVVLPLLVQLSGGPWVAILEADLRDYAGMYLGGVLGVADSLMAKLAPLPDQFYSVKPGFCASMRRPKRMSWSRVSMKRTPQASRHSSFTCSTPPKLRSAA